MYILPVKIFSGKTWGGSFKKINFYSISTQLWSPENLVRDASRS